MTREETALLLSKHDHFLIFTHLSPDGDTIGSAAALCHGLRSLGKTAFVAPNPDLTHRYLPYVEDLFPPALYPNGGAVSIDTPSMTAPDAEALSAYLAQGVCLISVDIATTDLLPSIYEPYAESIALAIDHHPSHTHYARHCLLEAGCASTGEIIYALLETCGVRLTRDIALPLYLAVSTDTGCFRYSNTTAQTHSIAARLMETGIDAGRINREMFVVKSYCRIQLEAAVFAGLRFYAEGKVALGVLTLETIRRFGASTDDMDNISALPRQIDGVDIGITVRQMSEQSCKISVRTSEAYVASEICAHLGGGGHARAAGCTFKGLPSEAEAAILEAVRAQGVTL